MKIKAKYLGCRLGTMFWELSDGTGWVEDVKIPWNAFWGKPYESFFKVAWEPNFRTGEVPC